MCLIAPSCKAEPSPAPSPNPPPQDNGFSFPPWDDFSIFEDSLIESEWQALESYKNFSIYHISLSISDDISEVEGYEEVLYTNNEASSLNEICLRLFPKLYEGNMQVSSIKINDTEAAFYYEDEDTTLKIALNNPLEQGISTAISMYFSFDVPRNVLASYGTFGYAQDILSLDCFYPVVAVFDENGWDAGIPPYYGDKTYLDSSFYIVEVEAPDDFIIASSGIELESFVEQERKRAVFTAGPSRDFFISASDRFKKISTIMGETIINSYYVDENTAGTPAFILEAAANTLNLFNTKIGDYSYTELDIVPLPLQAGALGIEYPGIIGICTSIYSEQNINLEASLTHEIAHQWFYNAIGNDQVNEPWLDEGFAQYATGIYFENSYGEEGWEAIYGSWLNRWSQISFADIPIGMSVIDYAGSEYGAIIYGKAPVFIHELALAIGEDAFFSFLRDYYLNFKWEIVDTSSFYSSMEAYCLCDLSALFSEWVYPQ